MCLESKIIKKKDYHTFSYNSLCLALWLYRESESDDNAYGFFKKHGVFKLANGLLIYYIMPIL